MAGQKPNELDALIGARLREARLEAGMTQRALGHALGFSAAQVQKYENGTNCLNASCLHRAASVLERPVLWFYGTQREEGPELFPLARALIARVSAAAIELDSVLANGGA